jgi:hypothetical protein
LRSFCSFDQETDRQTFFLISFSKLSCSILSLKFDIQKKTSIPKGSTVLDGGTTELWATGVLEQVFHTFFVIIQKNKPEKPSGKKIWF